MKLFYGAFTFTLLPLGVEKVKALNITSMKGVVWESRKRVALDNFSGVVQGVSYRLVEGERVLLVVRALTAYPSIRPI